MNTDKKSHKTMIIRNESLISEQQAWVKSILTMLKRDTKLS